MIDELKPNWECFQFNGKSIIFNKPLMNYFMITYNFN